MNRLKMLLTVLLLILVNPVFLTASEDEQLYFVGMSAPVGSISSDHSTQNAIYLRWDIIEGTLPSDVQEFILFKNDTLKP